MHQQIVLSLAVICHLLFHTSNNVLLGLSCESEIALSLCKLFLHFTDIVLTDVLDGRHLREINTFSEAGHDTSFKHPRETWNGDPIFLIDLLDLLVSQLIIHCLARLRIRV